MVDEKQEVSSKTTEVQKSKGMPTIAKVGIGCFVILVLFGIVATIAGGWFIKKAGKAMLEKTIESQTGVKTDLKDLAEGKMSFTDEKTGQKVDIGSGSIPDSFPKDFPIYPGSTVTSSMSGSGQDEKSGFWITLTSADSFSKVKDYYTTNLKTSGWIAQGTFESGTNLTQTIGKGELKGSVTINRESSDSETTILIILGTDTPTDTSSDQTPPIE